jgi:L-galactose dehydrogenase/L-glyceraldehyde 3-phosphate reductase
MNYRAFGKTGIQVSEIVFGCGYVGGLMIHQDEDTRQATIEMALEQGINWFDTAASYGKGASEKNLGRILPHMPQRHHLSTKFSVEPSRPESLESQIRRSLEASLSRLQMDSVELFQLHNPLLRRVGKTSDTGFQGLQPKDILKTNGVLDILNRLKEEGFFRWIGMTALGDADACIEVIRSSGFDSAQVYYNLLNPSAGMALPESWTGHPFDGLFKACSDADTAVMNIRVFAAGVIPTDVRHGREIVITNDSSIPEEERRVNRVFKAIGNAYGTRAQTALRFSLAHETIACVVVGLAEIEHLQEALEAESQGGLPEEALSEVSKAYASFS